MKKSGGEKTSKRIGTIAIKIFEDLVFRVGGFKKKVNQY